MSHHYRVTRKPGVIQSGLHKGQLEVHVGPIVIPPGGRPRGRIVYALDPLAALAAAADENGTLCFFGDKTTLDDWSDVQGFPASLNGHLYRVAGQYPCTDTMVILLMEHK